MVTRSGGPLVFLRYEAKVRGVHDKMEKAMQGSPRAERSATAVERRKKHHAEYTKVQQDEEGTGHALTG